jgi:hypothetical protein
MAIHSFEASFLVSAGITLALSLVIAIYLRKPMQRILTELCGSAERIDYWIAFSNVMFVLAPVVLLLMAQTNDRFAQPLLVQVVDQLKWSLCGLFVAVVCVAVTIASFISRSRGVIAMHPDQMDDLRRLLGKVEEIRAREVLSRPG